MTGRRNVRPPRWRPDVAAHPARRDGERVRAGVVAQPANAASSIAYLAAGAWLWRRRRHGEVPALRGAVAAALVADGVGGVGFHGPGDRASRWVHDVGLLTTVAALGAVDLVRAGRLTHRGGIGALAGVAGGAAVVVGVRPGSTNLLSAALGGAAAAAQVMSARRGPRADRRAVRLRAAAAGLAATGALVNVASRPGGPWSRPDARLQGHAAWHVLTAAALAAWAEGAMPS